MISAAPTAADWRRGFLRSIAWDAEESGGATSLEKQLKSVCRARFEQKDGKNLLTFAANGHSYAYEISKTLTPESVAALTSWLYDLHIESRAALVEAGTASPTDAQILAQMLTALVPVRVALIDRSEALR